MERKTHDHRMGEERVYVNRLRRRNGYSGARQDHDVAPIGHMPKLLSVTEEERWAILNSAITTNYNACDANASANATCFDRIISFF